MPAEDYEQSSMPEFHAPSLHNEDYDPGVAPVCPVFPEELERIRAEREHVIEVAPVLFTFAASSSIAFTALVRGLMGISEIIYETATDQPDAYEFMNSVAALRLSGLVGAIAALGFGIHIFNKDMQDYRQHRSLEESKEEG